MLGFPLKLLAAFAIPWATATWRWGGEMGVVSGVVGTGLLLLWRKNTARNRDAEAALRTRGATLSVVPDHLHALLSRAALEFAQMSPSRFDEKGVLHVGSTELRRLGLIDTVTWAKVPAHDSIAVRRLKNGQLETRILLPGTEAAFLSND